MERTGDAFFEGLEQEFIELGIEEKGRQYFDDLQDHPYFSINRLARLAAKCGRWDLAEAAYEHPSYTETDLYETHGGSNSTNFSLGAMAADMGDFDKARQYFGKISESEIGNYPTESYIVDAAIKQDRLEEATEMIRRVDFSVVIDRMEQTNLASLLYKICQTEDGPRRALQLLDELVPRPNPLQTAHPLEIPRYDYFLEPIAPAAIQHHDFEIAEEVIERTNDWFGPGAAMGGGGLLDAMYGTQDMNVKAAILTLILRKWGNGRALEELPVLSGQVDDDVAEQIGKWLNDVARKLANNEYHEHLATTIAPRLENTLAIYTRTKPAT